MPLIDSPHTSPALRALALSTLLACAASLAGCRDASAPPAPTVSAAPAASTQAAPPAGAPAASASTKEQAMATLMALPELKAWSAYIAKTSGDKAHGGLLDDGSIDVKGKRYWQFGFVENSSDAAHRWQSFLVGQSDGEILVADDAADANLTLAQWRKDKQPMQRIVAAP